MAKQSKQKTDHSQASVDKHQDPVDEAIEESFPASDPPAYSAGTATPSSTDADANAKKREE